MKDQRLPLQNRKKKYTFLREMWKGLCSAKKKSGTSQKKNNPNTIIMKKNILITITDIHGNLFIYNRQENRFTHSQEGTIPLQGTEIFEECVIRVWPVDMNFIINLAEDTNIYFKQITIRNHE
jgi:hypothetical protein